MASSSPSYAVRANLELIDSLYIQYKENPGSVSTEWQRFFEGVDFVKPDSSLSGNLSQRELSVYNLIWDYRNYGHLEANLNPLADQPPKSEQLQLKQFGLTEQDLDTSCAMSALVGLQNATLRQVIQHLRAAYCGTITVQYSEALPPVRDWLIEQFERTKVSVPAERKKLILESLARAESLEKFIHTRYVGTKRFSVEGGDSLLPMLEALVENSPSAGVQEVVIGMAHRGRVNVLANFMGKALKYIFADFNGPTETTEPIDDFDGDVKYHLGYKTEKTSAKGGSCTVSLAFNPSHLEAVNPVVLGMTRAAQRRRKDTKERKTVVPVLIHGDAAFAGQGVIQETFQLSQVKGYRVGGTIHIAIDNQVGFTTKPENSRSSYYCTDVAKILGAPVFHVNGDDPEACVRAIELALMYRQKWNKDVVVNLICYRRFGHNEGDEPAYTQPVMYEKIKKHPTTLSIYSQKLIQEGVVTQAQFDAAQNTKIDELQKIYEDTKKHPPRIEPFKFDGFWKGLRKGTAEDFVKSYETKTTTKIIEEVGQCISTMPKDFNLHPKLHKLVESRKLMSLGKEPIDWGTAELFAYGSLLVEGGQVRLTGQDCVRGTFTHRHAGFYDSKNGEAYIPLKHIRDGQEFCIYDSILSEYAVLGFEYGNSIMDPTFLTIWEAQFGDFANGAQIIIDQFLSAGEAKWQQMSGLVLLLPHGYEGQGPEHSSARLERFLQLCAHSNMQVMNLTTPAQIFHALRRQVKRPFRKPMVVMSPKSLLRHPKAVSSVSDLTEGGFQEIIDDGSVTAKSVEKVIL